MDYQNLKFFGLLVHLLGFFFTSIKFCYIFSLCIYFNGCHHIEDIMYRNRLDRSTIKRVIDTFPQIIQSFELTDSPASF